MNKSAPPERLTDFVGQDDLLEETIPQSLRCASGRRPVVLLSVLGSGATAVAVEYLHRTYPRYYAAAEWIDCSDGSEIAGSVAQATHRFREVGGPALLVLDGVAQPERVAALLPAGGPDVLITSSADATAWPLAERVLKVTALMPHDSVRLLCRYEPGLPKREAELLAPASTTHRRRWHRSESCCPAGCPRGRCWACPTLSYWNCCVTPIPPLTQPGSVRPWPRWLPNGASRRICYAPSR